MDVEFDTTEADARREKLAQYLSPKALAIAGSRAANRAATAARAEGARAIRGDLALKVGDIRKRMTIERATTTDITAKIELDGNPIPMSTFNPGQRSYGVSVRMKKSAGRKRIEGAFIIKRYDGEVFVRRYGDDGEQVGRGPLLMLYGPSIRSQFDRAQPAMEAKAAETIGKRVPAEIDRQIKRANR